MLVIDENMFKLAKMQETLLKVSTTNKEENLSNYKKTVMQIDQKAFSDILEEINHINEHNHSLESELEFLEKIKKTYDQLLELQLSFKRVCEIYGGSDLELSDLSLLNIDYIENRINAINGYLINLRNIEINKRRLQELNEQLVDEEKKKSFLDKRILELEKQLRENFLNAEGRLTLNGNLEPTSVVKEYQKIAIDITQLLIEPSDIDVKLSQCEAENEEVTEKLRTAVVCYNSILNSESRQILEEIKRDEINIKYKLTMLKILKLLSQNFSNYDSARNKRENLQDLIKYRQQCLDYLGIHISIDPFGRTRIKEQLETILSLTDNTKNINIIRKEISELNSRTEQMLNENSNYLILLSETRTLIEDRLSINDVDITGIDTIINDFASEKKEFAENQVKSIKFAPDRINMPIIKRKTEAVIRRVQQMIGVRHPEPQVSQSTIVPELIIVGSENKVEYESGEKNTYDKIIPFKPISRIESQISTDVAEKIKPVYKETTPTESLFETIEPFSAPSLFTERTEENMIPEILTTSEELPQINEEIIQYENLRNEEMPDAFWTVDNNDDIKMDDEPIEDEEDFDTAIERLLSESNSKVRKKAA